MYTCTFTPAIIITTLTLIGLEGIDISIPSNPMSVNVVMDMPYGVMATAVNVDMDYGTLTSVLQEFSY